MKIKVPQGMLKAAKGSLRRYEIGNETEEILEAALRWLSENPIGPSSDKFDDCIMHLSSNNPHGRAWQSLTETMRARMLAVEWQRRMFLAPEPEIPEEIKDLMDCSICSNLGVPTDVTMERNAAVIEAYRRGRRSKS